MAWYRKFEGSEIVWVEQNIFDNGELESYDARIKCVGGEKTAVLFFYEEDGKRFYSLGLLESAKDRGGTIISSDLSEIFKFKTAKTRRKHLSKLIKENEQSLNSSAS